MKTKLSKLNFVLILVSIISISFAQAQERLLKGTVTSLENGNEEPLPGATLLLEGTSTGTTADIDGNFSIMASSEDVLVVSFIGYKTVKIPIANRSVINISLESDISALSEVVVVGYGAVKKSDLTGSVASVNSEALTAFPTLSATQALQGRAAGVQVQSNNGGEPGANLNIKIRGGTSINANSDPIVVVDGFVGAEMPPPEDIASMEVLKDASATAIYGSRGANGVIMVTTKRGKSGGTRVEFNSSYSYQEASNQIDLLDGQEFADYRQEFGNYEFQGSNTNWQDVVFRPGYIANNQLSVSGGNETTRFYLSGTYFDQEGILLGSDYQRYSLNSNVDIEVNERVKVGFNLYGRRSTTNGVKTQEGSGGTGQAGVIGSALRFNPDVGIYNDNGSFVRAIVGGGELDNPFAIADQYQRERTTDRFQSNVYAEFEILDWLSFKSTLGVGNTNWRDGEFYPTTLIFGEGVDGVAGIEARKQFSLLSENYFTIDKEFGIHEFSWVNGYSFQKNTSEAWETVNSGFISNSGSFWALNQGSNPGTPFSGFSQTIIRSFYSRLNYSLLDKYNFTFTGRQDGASNFAANKKWAFFPSGAFGWNLIEESFMEPLTSTLSELKLRASFGYVGNQAISAYQSLALLEPTYSIVNGDNALKVGELANNDLSWETTQQLDLGLDLGLLNGRVFLTADYYEKTTKDLLFRRPLPSYVGVPTQLQNIGSVSNKGYELTLNTKNLVGDLQWSTDLIFASNRNKVLALPDSVELYGNGPGHLVLDNDNQLLLEGQPIGVFYGYVYDGIYQTGDTFIPGTGFEQVAGGEKFKDISGPNGEPDGVLNAFDRTIIGDPNPDFTWSLNNTLSYKNFDFNLFVMGVHGNDMLSYTLLELETFSGKGNVTTTALQRWTPENPNTDVPRANASRSFRVSDKFIYDGSFIRVKNIVLGYTFPKSILERIKVNKIRVYASAQNLFTFTKYPGLDPEVGYENSGSAADGNRKIGLDYASYPNVKSYTFGINIGF